MMILILEYGEEYSESKDSLEMVQKGSVTWLQDYDKQLINLRLIRLMETKW